jgi:hypothetical protein
MLNPAQSFGPRVLDFIHPIGGEATAPAWHRAALRLGKRGAFFADRALA